MSTIEFGDMAYFDECIRDQNSLFVEVTIRRCISIQRNSSYPDDPPTMRYVDIPVKADIREVPLNEIAHSGGILLTGDNTIWIRGERLKGPSGNNSSDTFDPEAVADLIIIHNQLYTIVGSPLIGRLKSTMIAGTQAYIRRQVGDYVPLSDPAHDQVNP